MLLDITLAILIGGSLIAGIVAIATVLKPSRGRHSGPIDVWPEHEGHESPGYRDPGRGWLP